MSAEQIKQALGLGPGWIKLEVEYGSRVTTLRSFPEILKTTTTFVRLKNQFINVKSVVDSVEISHHNYRRRIRPDGNEYVYTSQSHHEHVV